MIQHMLLACWALLSTVFAHAQPEKSGDAECEISYQDEEIFSALAGTYSLINSTNYRNGKQISNKGTPYGEHPVGLITYSASGWMSATITATEREFRPNLTFPFQPNDTDADWAVVGKHSLGYAGPYQVNRELPCPNSTYGQLFHGPLAVASVPSWQGTLQRRNYSVHSTIDGKLLRIGSDRGGGNTAELWWRKVD
ncbi:hypothetical protein AC579_3136 [Pseudocercospora musae]|uniref:Lipocalin-like domain-containing protein n=1 Tax=Pseudocercospora musae TaxID=113226 RepID=A0A139I4F6_9PEZI|nr:hypothetical protein AC579_3136 [Pseudocercospora musae]KXT09634.1 hypothetical protein AC579_3136 [Pseudocercospora musae]